MISKTPSEMMGFCCVNLTYWSNYGIIVTCRILLCKILKSFALCAHLSTVTIYGVVKMPLQANIFTPGIIVTYINCVIEKSFGWFSTKAIGE